MAKKVVYHWVEMRHIEVPDECPTDTYTEMLEWLEKQDLDEALINIKADTRDCEIVDVTKVK